MKKHLFILFTLLIIGCGSGEEYKETNYYESKITDWQTRQSLCALVAPSVITGGKSHKLIPEPSGNLIDDIGKVLDYLPPITLLPEEIDYWKTSEELLKDKIGDCEDAAGLSYIAIRDSGITDFYNAELYIQIVHYEGDKNNHAICLVVTDEETLVIDNIYWIYDYNLENYDKIIINYNDTSFWH